jgi:regulator of replication initiation timing
MVASLELYRSIITDNERLRLENKDLTIKLEDALAAAKRYKTELDKRKVAKAVKKNEHT